MRIDTQVILVSGQPTPNLTPALDPELKPATVIMLVSPDMRRRADWLAEVLQPRGIRVERRELADPYDVDDLRERLLNLAAEHEHETLALNVTGGTKLMAIAAYDVYTNSATPSSTSTRSRTGSSGCIPRGFRSVTWPTACGWTPSSAPTAPAWPNARPATGCRKTSRTWPPAWYGRSSAIPPPWPVSTGRR